VQGETRQTVQLAEQRVGFEAEIVSDERVQEFYRHWLSLKRDRHLPSKSDFDPTAVPHLLPGIILLRVHDDPVDFEYRIIGEDVAQRLGSLKGRRVREAALLNIASSAYANYCAVVEQRRPQFLEGRAMTVFRDRPLCVSRVHCPYSSDSEAIDYIMSYVAFV
jgi:hypothetical protein